MVIAGAGIRLTARTQVAMGVIEYVILIGFSIWGLVFALGHHHGTFPITSDWFSLGGIGGEGRPAPRPLLPGVILGRRGAPGHRPHGGEEPARTPGKAPPHAAPPPT